MFAHNVTPVSGVLLVEGTDCLNPSTRNLLVDNVKQVQRGKLSQEKDYFHQKGPEGLLLNMVAVIRSAMLESD